jgi:hypothetical protein
MAQRPVQQCGWALDAAEASADGQGSHPEAGPGAVVQVIQMTV